MDRLYEAVAALKHGYEVEEKSMYDNGMIGYAETLTSHHDELIEALATAAAFNDLVKSLGEKLGPEIVASLNKKVDEHRSEILASGPVVAGPKI
ncbi:hypothetical protein [Rhizobium sp. MHM7A]|uniref:hypothetical protein n=1 Tax=Rhizobium sp. MHM7A TaxID=2583233 RepID=UPI001105E8C6|nr:hypothetical protein [Rhizobium sp. MHM7A]TLX16252.1 hypothetical protein FFR93_02680 [Rhizobium sp. MHM7A]